MSWLARCGFSPLLHPTPASDLCKLYHGQLSLSNIRKASVLYQWFDSQIFKRTRLCWLCLYEYNVLWSQVVGWDPRRSTTCESSWGGKGFSPWFEVLFFPSLAVCLPQVTARPWLSLPICKIGVLTASASLACESYVCARVVLAQHVGIVQHTPLSLQWQILCLFSYSLYAQFWEVSSTYSSSPFLSLLFWQWFFVSRNSHPLPLFSEELVLMYYGCETVSHLSEDTNSIFQGSLLWMSHFLWGEFCVYPGPPSPIVMFSPKVCLSPPVLIYQ